MTTPVKEETAKEKTMKDWIKENINIISMISTIVVATWFIRTEIHTMDKSIHAGMYLMDKSIHADMHSMETRINDRINSMETRINEQIKAIDKRITIMETIMMMQGYPLNAIAMQEEYHDSDRDTKCP